MSTSSHDRPPARAAAARARARRFQNAVLNHTGPLLEAGAEEPGDVERYHMAWLSVHALTGVASAEDLRKYRAARVETLEETPTPVSRSSNMAGLWPVFQSPIRTVRAVTGLLVSAVRTLFKWRRGLVAAGAVRAVVTSLPRESRVRNGFESEHRWMRVVNRRAGAIGRRQVSAVAVTVTRSTVRVWSASSTGEAWTKMWLLSAGSSPVHSSEHAGAGAAGLCRGPASALPAA